MKSCLVKSFDIFAVPLVHFADVMFDEQRDVAHAFSQRRHSQFNDVDPVEKVLPERSSSDAFFEVFIGGKNQANVDFVSGCPADRFEFPILQNPQEFDLKTRRCRRDFVEEDRSAVCLQEFADFVVIGSGEGASNVAEQFAFEQRVRQCSTRNFDECLIAARAELMHGSRGHRFTGSAFAENHDGGSRVGDAFDQVEHLLHFVVAADNVRETEAFVELLAQALVLFHDRSLTERSLDGEVQFVIDDGLG